VRVFEYIAGDRAALDLAPAVLVVAIHGSTVKRPQRPVIF
jgi:hypothetical protein